MPKLHLSEAERLKVGCLSHGIRIDQKALYVLSDGGRLPLSVHEYATTGGITLELEGAVFVNAPFDEWYCKQAEAELTFEAGRYLVRDGDGEAVVERVLPLPGYLEATDEAGSRVTDTMMSHADRIRVSPIVGCAYSCDFCDLPSESYQSRTVEQLERSFDVAATDKTLPPRHVLVSGGSPGRRDQGYFEDACRAIITRAASVGMETDIMMSAYPDDVGFVDRIVAAGVAGFSINIELFSGEAASLFIHQKQRFTTRPGFERFVRRAVEKTGGDGRVRSLIIVGLEAPEETLAGVEYLAGLGVDPVLSPFRPARRTKLLERTPPSPQMLLDVYTEAADIVRRHGVRLGPRCVPCQHNTLTFPRDALDPV